jgi:hypothetical protein
MHHSSIEASGAVRIMRRGELCGRARAVCCAPPAFGGNSFLNDAYYFDHLHIKAPFCIAQLVMTPGDLLWISAFSQISVTVNVEERSVICLSLTSLIHSSFCFEFFTCSRARLLLASIIWHIEQHLHRGLNIRLRYADIVQSFSILSRKPTAISLN